MTVGERFVNELMSRDLPREVLDYEQLQHLKTFDSTGELRAWLSQHVFQRFDDSDEISDMVDQTLIPSNRHAFWTKRKVWAVTAFMAVVSIECSCSRRAAHSSTCSLCSCHWFPGMVARNWFGRRSRIPDIASL